MTDGQQEKSDRFGRIWNAKNAGDVAYLVQALTDPDHCASAARFLAELGAQDAAIQIVKLLDVTDPTVRAQAAKALGTLRAKAAVPRLIETARDDPDDVVRSYAVGGLGRIGDDEANPTLEALLSDNEVWIRRGAATALAETGSDSAIGPLRAASRRDRWWRRHRYTSAVREIRKRSAQRA